MRISRSTTRTSASAAALLASLVLSVGACDQAERRRISEPRSNPSASTGDDGGAQAETPDAGEAGATVDAGQTAGLADAGRAEDAACVPACAGRQCGDDGCNSTCGTCTGTQMCTAGGQCQEPGPVCPPPGPYGTNLGAVVPDVALPDCDGNMHTLHDLCAKKAAWLWEFAPW